MRNFTDLPPLSLYIHIPWCLKKCPYCDFNSHENRHDVLPEQEYVDALLADLQQELPEIWGRQIVSIFIGGGTPSLFSASAIDSLLSGVRALTAASPTVEITMEANPGTFEQKKFRDFREAGINRLSIGVQSFNDQCLNALGRVHDSGEAERAFVMAREAGFDNINIDLMYGLPEQSLTMAHADLSTAINLQPEHISYYQLTLEPNTLFASQPPALPHDDIRWDMHTQGVQLLSEYGFKRYEVSAYARDNNTCQHNQNYWLYGDYVGIGAGAHGKLSMAATGEIVRRWKRKHPTQYLEHAHSEQRIGGQHTVTAEDTALDFLMNALRLTDGFTIPLFQLHTGMALHQWQTVINKAIDDGLLETKGVSLSTTEHGFDYLNELLERFIPDEAEHRYPVIPLLQSKD